MSSLLSRYDMRGQLLSSRVVMGPMTRCRAPVRGMPTELIAEYYVQRASAGLIVTEGTNVSAWSAAFELTPGIFTREQVNAWAGVVKQVHDAGGRIFSQLWHGGRISSFVLLEGQEPLSPTGLNDDLEKLQVWAQLQNGQYTRIYATPSRAMTLDEVAQTVAEYRQAAANAMEADFDGVEVHAANGYLPHQFLSATTNTRDDRYGGSIENRTRFLQEIMQQIGEVMPLNRVGVRISPFAHYNNVRDGEVAGTYHYVARMLEEFGVAYIHAADTNAWTGEPDLAKIIDIVREGYTGTLMVNGGISVEQADALIRQGHADLVAFARAYIANPDLVERIACGAPLAVAKPIGWYGGDHTGYTDYPFHTADGFSAGGVSANE